MRRLFLAGFLLTLIGTTGAPPELAAFDFTFGGRSSQAEGDAVPQPVQEEAVPDPMQAEIILQTAEEAAAQGDFTQAVSLLRDFLENYPGSPQADEARLAMARIFLDRGQHLEALLALDRITGERRRPDQQLVEGAALVASGAIDEGSERLRGLDPAALSPADRLRRLVALGTAAGRRGQPLEALALYRRAASLAGDAKREELIARSHRILAGGLDDAQLAEAAFMFGGDPIGQDALLQQARSAAETGEDQKSRRLLEKVLGNPVPFDYHQDAVALWERLTGETWLKRAVGVMLPQSGRYATFGALVRRGMELAQQVHNEAGNEPVRFIFTDTAADAERSEELVAELAIRERVMAIAGPLTGSAAETAARQAQRQGVPLLALSQREGLPKTGDYIFRNSLTSRLQARALARYAVEEKGMTAFGVLYPDNRLGRELSEVFAQEVLKLGGLVTARESYDGKATDFGRQIKLLKGEDPDAPDLEESLSGQELLEDLFLPDKPEFPPVDFDALFIPDYADRVALIAPQLVFYGIEEIPLLGINGWNSPELIRSAGRFVEGAVFVDGFFRYSTYPFVREFVDRYFARYGEEPTILEAQGFDAASILLTLANRPDVTTREALRLALDQLDGYPGVTGATSFNLQGDADKVLFLLQIQNGNIVQIN